MDLFGRANKFQIFNDIWDFIYKIDIPHEESEVCGRRKKRAVDRSTFKS